MGPEGSGGQVWVPAPALLSGPRRVSTLLLPQSPTCTPPLTSSGILQPSRVVIWHLVGEGQVPYMN
jgi:hypothetical protein